MVLNDYQTIDREGRLMGLGKFSPPQDWDTGRNRTWHFSYQRVGFANKVHVFCSCNPDGKFLVQATEEGREHAAAQDPPPGERQYAAQPTSVGVHRVGLQLQNYVVDPKASDWEELFGNEGHFSDFMSQYIISALEADAVRVDPPKGGGTRSWAYRGSVPDSPPWLLYLVLTGAGAGGCYWLYQALTGSNEKGET
ncbi:unnamed protein product [Pedinophyceae sp. YPF-701]|nr:unnamed protein product [Pedinophyceae sp. YPF-701]